MSEEGIDVRKRCPHCHKRLRVREAVIRNIDSYQKTARAEALCCGYGVMIAPIDAYDVFAASTNLKEDDWGHKLKGS